MIDSQANFVCYKTWSRKMINLQRKNGYSISQEFLKNPTNTTQITKQHMKINV